MAQALTQLQLRDRLRLNVERECLPLRQCPEMHYNSELQLQPYQPVTEDPWPDLQAAAAPMSEVAELHLQSLIPFACYIKGENLLQLAIPLGIAPMATQDASTSTDRSWSFTDVTVGN